MIKIAIRMAQFIKVCVSETDTTLDKVTRHQTFHSNFLVSYLPHFQDSLSQWNKSKEDAIPLFQQFTEFPENVVFSYQIIASESREIHK